MPWKATLTVLIALSSTAASRAAIVVGDIQVVYESANPFGIAEDLDGPVFVLENRSALPITDGLLKIGPVGATPDSFRVPTIAPGSFVLVEPGLSDDGGTGHNFFAHTGTLLDTSDYGPFGLDVQFEFVGLSANQAVDSGIFTPRMSANGAGIDAVGFLGGYDPYNGEHFGPKVVATIGINPNGQTFPEPASWLLLAAGLAILFVLRRRGRASRVSAA